MQEKAGEIKQTAIENDKLNISHTAEAEESLGEEKSFDFGKFSSAKDLLNAYNSLEAEFTRRCQKSKELERENERLKQAEQTSKESGEKVFQRGKKFQENYPETQELLPLLYEIAANSKDEAEGFMERAYVKYLKTELDKQRKYYQSSEYVTEKAIDNKTVQDKIIREYLLGVEASKPKSRQYLGNGQGIVTPPLKPTTLAEATKIANEIFKNSKEIK